VAAIMLFIPLNLDMAKSTVTSDVQRLNLANICEMTLY